MTSKTTARRMPAEWEKHAATWIAWPHEESDWPGKFETVAWVYCEIVRLLALSEKVHIVCKDEEQLAEAQEALKLSHVEPNNCHFHILKTDRSWLRDSAPTAVFKGQKLEWINWKFNAWAKYDNFSDDLNVPALVSKVSSHPLVKALRPDSQQPFVLEGGAIDCDGAGTLLVTEECLLSEVQSRNPGLSREGYENAFLEYLGVTKTIWLARGCEGDDTHGHIDDIARFTAPGKVLLAFEEDSKDPNHEISVENLNILNNATDASGNKIAVTKLPMPRAVYFDNQRLPASYANFYIANSIVIVPTFNDLKDLEALNIIAKAFPNHKIAGINCLDLVLGLGTLHCLTQQEPLN